MNFTVILQAILPVYLLVGVGLALRGFGVVTKEMEKGMIKLVIHYLYPCLILDKTLGNSLVRQGDVLVWGVGLGFGLVILGMLVSYAVALILGLKPGSGRRTFCVSVGVQNYGYIAIPMLAALFVMGGDDRVFGVLFIHSLGGRDRDLDGWGHDYDGLDFWEYQAPHQWSCSFSCSRGSAIIDKRVAVFRSFRRRTGGRGNSPDDVLVGCLCFSDGTRFDWGNDL